MMISLDRLLNRAMVHYLSPRPNGKMRPAPEYIELRLSERLMHEAARGNLDVPRHFIGVPVRISEQPGRINNPSGLPMVSAMVKGYHAGAGSIVLDDGGQTS